MANNGRRSVKQKKGPTVGTGGHGRKALEGKGPTPKAEDRVYHKAHKNKQLAERSAAKRGTGARSAGARSGPKGRATEEVVTGRNSVVEALRAGTRGTNAKLNAVADFTRAVIRGRGRVEDSELATFRAAGFNDQQALEVVLGVSLATLCNFANNLGQPPLNTQLQPYAWDGAPAIAAE